MVIAVTTTGRPLDEPVLATSARCRSRSCSSSAFLVVQVIVGLVTGSLALLSDAGHMATDALGLGMALAAIHAASSARANPPAHVRPVPPRDPGRAGQRRAAVRGGGLRARTRPSIRLGEPPEIASLPVLVVGLLGLAVNIVAFLLLRPGPKESLNVEGAYLEVLSDTLGSLGVVIVAALVWGATGWAWVDPVVGAAIGVFILPRASGSVARPSGSWCRPRRRASTSPALRADLAGIPGVVDVHDLHVWTLTSDMEVASAHLMVRSGTDSHGVLDQARDLLERPSRPGPRHPPDRARRPPGLRRDHLVTAARSPQRERWRRP